MSTKTKLEKNNRSLNDTNKNLIAIKNAFLRPLPQYNGNIITSQSGINTSDADATASDILLNKTAYVKGEKIIGSHVCQQTTVYTESKIVTPTTETQIITPSDGKYLSMVTIKPIPTNYIIPSGNLDITENGTHNVKNYETISVNIPSPTVSFDSETGTLTITGVS